MKAKSKKQFTPFTWRQLFDAFKRLDLSKPAWIEASTNPDEPDEGRDYVELAGVRKASVEDGVLSITCYRQEGKRQPMTWGELLEAVVPKVADMDKIAFVKIGYGLKYLVDYYGQSADECRVWSWAIEPGIRCGDFLFLKLEVPW